MFMAILALIPGALNFANNITTAIFNAKVQIMSARIGGDVERARQIVSLAQTEAHERTAWMAVVAGNTLLTLLVIFFALPFGIFIWKVVVWDIVLQSITHGSTDAIKGQVADWGNTIIIAIFGSSTTIQVGKMIMANRSDK